ncbi:MAG: RNA polymerase sigma factor [Planctomycetota bacterium]|jgi:RNA polymerase sigma factor (sigma-70 family)
MEPLAPLAERARSGDRAALEELLHRSAGIVHAVARARLGDSLAADGAAADALARVALRITTLRDAEAYPGWLYRITTRCVAGAAPEPCPPERERTAPGPGPVETLVAAERAQRVRVAVAGLSMRLREPVYLHFAEGLTYREVADVTGIGIGSVSRRIRRALELLRARLEDES